MMLVKQVTAKECYDMLLHVHYAKRIPSISYAFGLFVNNELEGCVCYGTPPSPTLRNGIAGKELASRVLELNRLVLKTNQKNHASYLVGRSLRMLPKPSIVISFADTAQGHEGIVYQACNFTYCGLSAKRTDWKVRGLEHLHGQTIADMSRGVKDRAAWMREKFGEDFYLQPRSRKHRYIYVCANKGQAKELWKNIKYKKAARLADEAAYK